MDCVNALRKELRELQPEISERLAFFRSKWEKGSREVFSELVFCLCTPQSSALKCDEAVRLMKRRNCFDSRGGIRRCLLSRVRFHNNKTNHILEANEFFSENGRMKIKDILMEQGIEEDHAMVRGWLDKNVKGLGLKEASHFLRNVGFYENIAILDRHILKNLVKLEVVARVPASLNRKKYLEIEGKLIAFCEREGIRPEELDLALWARETGFVFK